MRIFGLIALVVALAVVGVLASKQLTSVRTLPTPASPTNDNAAPTTVRQQSREVQEQYKQAIEGALQQQQRRMPDE